MTRLGLADLVLIAARVLDVPADRAARLVDLDTAAAALARARAAGERPERSAAALLAGLVRPPVARHGAARVALAAAVQLLAMDGWDLDLDPPEEVSELLLQVAGGGVLEGQLADWLAARLDHRERAPGEVRTGVHGTDADGTDADGTDADETREVGMFERLTGRRRPRAGGLFQRFTPRARQAVEIAQQEARLLNHNYIGTEHILLGLIHEGEGVAAKALESLGISLEAVRAQVEEI
ncbi:MAG TPA: Clp protease N-terminal domain-containing protein, partial [Actinomycetes bacterium]|nr:Clp protease N-terminal domain-containing protein [Actinomycetes bacterium]